MLITEFCLCSAVDMPSEKFSHRALSALSESDRNNRLRELEVLVNDELLLKKTLPEFQQHLYLFIDKLCAVGHFLGRWDYDCEIEYWGGKSYMNLEVEDELLLRSEFPCGIRLAWKDYDALQGPVI